MKTPLYILLAIIGAASMSAEVSIPAAQTPQSTDDSPVISLLDGKATDLPTWIEDIYINEQDLFVVGSEKFLPPNFRIFTINCYNRYGMLVGSSYPIRIQENGFTYWNSQVALESFPLEAILKNSALVVADDILEIAWLQIKPPSPRSHRRVIQSSEAAIKAE